MVQLTKDNINKIYDIKSRTLISYNCVNCNKFCIIKDFKPYKIEKYKHLLCKSCMQKLTNLQKYGDPNYNNSEKIKQTCMEKYGTDNVSKNKNIRLKISNNLKSRSEEMKRKSELQRRETLEKIYGKDWKYKTSENARKWIKEHPEEMAKAVSEGYKRMLKYKKEEIKQKHIKFWKNASKKYIKHRTNKIKETKLKLYNDPNYNNRIKFKNTMNKIDKSVILKKRQDTNLKKYGAKEFFNSNQYKQKSKDTLLKKYGVDNYFASKEFTKHMFDVFGSIHANFYLYFYGTYFDSLCELAIWIYCIDYNIPIIREPCILYYEYDNKKYRYVPDFMINGELVEIKGDQYFKDDGTMYYPYNKRHHNGPEFTEEEKEYYNNLYEAKHQCGLQNNVKFLKSSECQKYIKYVNDTYGKNYLKSFNINNPHNPSYWVYYIPYTNNIIKDYYVPKYVYNNSISPYNIKLDEDGYTVCDNKGISPFDIK